MLKNGFSMTGVFIRREGSEYAIGVDKGGDEAVGCVVHQIHVIREIQHGIHDADDGLRVHAMRSLLVFDGVFVRAFAQLLNESDDLFWLFRRIWARV